MKNKVLFLDRDGTINIDQIGSYVTKPAEFKLIPGVAHALIRAKNAGFKLAVITNQQGIGRGLYSIQDLNLVHQEMILQIRNETGQQNFNFDYIEFCPHLSKESCECRKPKPKMLLNAIQKLNADIQNSFYFGDKDADLLCAASAQIQSVLVRTGYGKETEIEIKDWNESKPVHVTENLSSGIDWILSR